MNCMCKRLLLLIVFLYTSNVIISQDLVISLDKKGNIGFATKEGELIIPHKYSTADPFINGVSKVSVNGKYGFINTSGQEILPLQYTSISQFKHGVAIIENNGKKGLINKDYKVIAEPIYTAIGKIGKSDYIWLNLKGKKMKGCATIIGGKSGIINKDGKTIIPVEKSVIIVFSDNLLYTLNDTMALPKKCDYFGFTTAYNSTRFAIVDTNSNILLPENKYSTVYAPNDGKIVFNNQVKNSIKQGFYDINTKQEYVIFSYEGNVKKLQKEIKSFVGNFRNGRSIVTNKDGNVYLMDDKGIKISDVYSSIKPVSNGSKHVYIAENASYLSSNLLDHNGNKITQDTEYTKIMASSDMNNLHFAAQKSDKWGMIDADNNEVLPFEYDDISDLVYERAKIKKGLLYGLVDYSRGIVIPCEYKNIFKATDKDAKYIWVQKSDNLWYRYDLQLGTVSDIGYKNATNYVGNTAFIQHTDADKCEKFIVGETQDNLYVMINEKDEIVLQAAISLELADKVWNNITEYMEKNNIDVLTPTQSLRILLDLTENIRTYSIRSIKIDESQWDY